MKSLRARLIVAALLWTVGITWVVHVVSPWIMHHMRHDMEHVHIALLTILAVALVLAGLSAARTGLSPLAALRARLAEVRAGRVARLEGEYASEVQPLVEDLNALLSDRERRVARAQAVAGDLAHGLKTPLSVLTLEAARMRSAGLVAEAAALEEQVGRMRGQVDYHLAQARSALSGASADARAPVLESVEGLARTLRKLYAERSVVLEVQVAAEHVVRVQREDLDEMLGNLLDNAFKFARSRVVVTSAVSDGFVVVTVEDDGPGIPAELRDAVLQRGVRADEAGPGSGLGLAIVRELAEVYGGRVEILGTPSPGAKLSMLLPVA